MFARKIAVVKVIHLLTMLIGFISTGVSSYVCPTQSCKCLAEIGYVDTVNVYCVVLMVNKETLSKLRIQPKYTINLNLTCYDSDDNRYGRLSDNMFSQFPDLKRLVFTNCKFDRIMRNSLNGLAALEDLQFYGSSFLSIDPAVLLAVPKLSRFKLRGTSITRLPPKFLCSLHDLEIVDISHNSMTAFSHAGLDCDAPFDRLILLDMRGNRLDEVPNQFSALFPNLIMCFLLNNHISYIGNDSFVNMRDLEYIFLDDNKLTEIPSTFLKRCPNLENVSVSYNHLRNLPSSIFLENPNLKFFNVSGNQIGDILWYRVANCKKLLYLDMGDVNLTYINQTVLRQFPMMQFLSLAKNKIRSVQPRVFRNLRALKRLFLNNNKLFVLRKNAFEGLTNLVELNLNENYITRIHSKVFLPCADKLNFLNLCRNLLPRVPFSLRYLSHLKSLDLRKNNIQNLTMDSFFGLDSLINLGLSANRIRVINRNVFSKCTNLIQLIIRNNYIDSIENGAFQGMNKLQQLFLDNNKIADILNKFHDLTSVRVMTLDWNHITGAIDSDMIPSYVKHLNLSHNLINEIKPYAFSKMELLESVDLRYNKITTLDIKSLMVMVPTKPNLYLQFNKLECTCEIVWMKKYYYNVSSVALNADLFKVQDLSLLKCAKPQIYRSQKVVELDKTNFLCSYDTVGICDRNCGCCDFRACNCKHVCPKNCSCLHNEDFSIHVINCTSSDIIRVPRFMSVSVTKLTLDGDYLGLLDESTFFGLNKLQLLLLNQSVIFGLSNNSFFGLPSLYALYLHDNEIQSLKSGNFHGLINMKELYLHNNKISYIDKGTFRHLLSLEYLTLHNNRLRTLSVLQEIPRGCVAFISDNPIICYNCSTFRIYQSTIIKYVSSIRDAKLLGCTFNSSTHQSDLPRFINFINSLGNFCEMTNQTVQSFNISTKSTHYDTLIDLPTKIVIIVILVTATLFSLFLIILVFRRRIKLVLFKYCGVRIGKSHKKDTIKKYDAFVSYSTKDESFVMHSLATRLENGAPKYRLCLHYRDFPVGECIAEVIIKSIENSSRTILILSDNFVTSEWCMFEFQKAHREALRKNPRALIVIILGNLNRDLLDSELRLYLNTKTYLVAGEAWFWEKLFFALPKKSCLDSENMVELTNRNERDIPSPLCVSTISTSDVSNDYHVYEEVA